MLDKDIYVLGIGHNTLNIVELAIDCGYKIAGLIHYDSSRTGEIYNGFPIIGSFEEMLLPELVAGRRYALSMGDLSIRSYLFKEITKLKGELPSLIHPSSYVSRYAQIGKGVQIQPHCVIESETIIGDNTTVVVNTIVHHNVTISHDDFIAGNVVVGAYTHIGYFVQIGQGAVIVSGKVKNIGNNCILGAGSVLLENMEDNSVYVGNPARFLKRAASIM